MKVIQQKCNFVICYLIVLCFYGCYLMINTAVQIIPESPVKQDNVALIRKRETRSSYFNNKPIESVQDFYDRLQVTETSCKKKVEVGGSSCKRASDHYKLFCMDDDIKINGSNCTVYSFGIGDDMSFDNSIYLYGCEVHMFDPTIPYSMVSDSLQDRLQFYQIGIHSVKTRGNFIWELPAEDGQKEKTISIQGHFDTYENIRKKLNHREKIVNYFKMDIDGTEWDVLPSMIRDGHFDSVSQFAIEIHSFDIIKMKTNQQKISYLQKLWDVLLMVKSIGFLKASYIPTPVLESLYRFPGTNKTVETCGEILFLKRGENLETFL